MLFLAHLTLSRPVQSINQSKRKTSNANGQTNLGHKHKAPDHKSRSHTTDGGFATHKLRLDATACTPRGNKHHH